MLIGLAHFFFQTTHAAATVFFKIEYPSNIMLIKLTVASYNL